MSRRFAVFVLLLLTTPLSAQLEVRGGARAGLTTSSGTAFGLEALLARGPFALSANGDHYDDITTVGIDAQYRFRLGRERLLWIAAGRTIVDVNNDVGSSVVWAPSAGFQWPLGKRQMILTLRHHNASRQIDPRFPAPDLNTTMFMVGIRSTNLLQW